MMSFGINCLSNLLKLSESIYMNLYTASLGQTQTLNSQIFPHLIFFTGRAFIVVMDAAPFLLAIWTHFTLPFVSDNNSLMNEFRVSLSTILPSGGDELISGRNNCQKWPKVGSKFLKLSKLFR